MWSKHVKSDDGRNYCPTVTAIIKSNNHHIQYLVKYTLLQDIYMNKSGGITHDITLYIGIICGLYYSFLNEQSDIETAMSSFV
jgi:hypothetical protein